eukprot:Colp12_sorted_trinity150504_noHs@28702
MSKKDQSSGLSTLLYCSFGVIFGFCLLVVAFGMTNSFTHTSSRSAADYERDVLQKFMVQEDANVDGQNAMSSLATPMELKANFDSVPDTPIKLSIETSFVPSILALAGIAAIVASVYRYGNHMRRDKMELPI